MSAKDESGEWIDVGAADELARHALQEVALGRTKIALTCVDGEFGAISGVCNHVGGPLGKGRLDGDYVECPWHYWKFHRATGEGEPGYGDDRVPRHDVRVDGGRVLVRREPATKRHKQPHERHPLARNPEPHDGPTRVLGISTTNLDPAHPRYSTSEALLESALAHVAAEGAETRIVKLAELAFRACEGFYSKSSRACTWPCSITQMDPDDRMDAVYEGLVHWADVVLVATPIRWGAASSLYFKMVERLNCVQNAITIANKVLIRDKVAALIITGGQDNVQGVAGQMLGFFAEIGFVFPPFPYVAHSRGWSAEDMENNVAYVQSSEELHQGARELAARAVRTAAVLRREHVCDAHVSRGGRKAHGGAAAAE
jgi:nitrite reductase/ring-hydroxylating ferredoxin subunit/multimeric flavodoxin WrbA